MIATIEHASEHLKINLRKPIDLSIPVSPRGPRAWYVNPARIVPVINRFFTGSVKLGGAVNFRDISFNPHGHGTHTESIGHITPELVDVNQSLTQFFFLARVITLTPEIAQEDSGWTKKGDRFIGRNEIEKAAGQDFPEALVVRTLPNEISKREFNYSDSNFCYFAEEALAMLAERDVLHLLTDLPSVDRESDGGLLKGHRAFWDFNGRTRDHCTITEFIFVPDHVKDGRYLLNLQLAPFSNDAAPSRPLLFELLD